MLGWFFTFFIGFAQAQSFCPSLEAVTFSASTCVPATDQICHSGQPGNCEIMGATALCRYIRFPGAHLYRNPEANQSFRCVAREPDICGGTPENPSCVPGRCTTFSPPTCVTQCKPCYHQAVVETQRAKGCAKFCGEESCSDEPRCGRDPCRPGQPCNPNAPCERKTIPGTTPPTENSSGGFTPPAGAAPDYILVANPPELCQNSMPCPNDPSTIPPEFQGATCVCNGGPCQFTPDGRVLPCNSGPTTCEASEFTPDTSPAVNFSCPWIEYVQRQPLCAPVAVGNRFPQDCCVCTGGQPAAPGVSCKSCGSLTQEICQ